MFLINIFYFYCLLERDVLCLSPDAKEYSGKIMTKYFELNDKKVNKDLQEKVRVNVQHQDQYHMDYATCTLI